MDITMNYDRKNHLYQKRGNPSKVGKVTFHEK